MNIIHEREFIPFLQETPHFGAKVADSLSHREGTQMTSFSFFNFASQSTLNSGSRRKLAFELAGKGILWFSAFALASVLVPYFSHADEPSASSSEEQAQASQEERSRPLVLFAQANRLNGVGLELGSNQDGTVNAGLVLRTHSIEDSSQPRGAVGSGSAELRVGRGLGISSRNNEGTNLITALVPEARNHGVTPIAAAHLLPLDFELNTNRDDVRQDYIEWMPHISGGLAVQLGELCGITARLKAGASIGTLGSDNGAGSMHGGALEIECDDRFGLSADHSVISRGPQRSVLSRIDGMLPLGENWSVGVYASRVRTENGDDSGFLALDPQAPAVLDETRAGVVVGAAF